MPQLTLDDVLDDLCTRFLVNLPASEYESFERLFFAIESAHWFYDDFHREVDPSLPRLQLKAFAARMFSHTPLLQPYREDVDTLMSDFHSYKQEVPTCGAAMLNDAMDKVVLVRGWGSGAKWGFPKGKVSKDETELAAAVREVYEETGFDLSSYTDDSTFFIDSMTGGRFNRIFIVPHVPEDAKFETLTRKEISKIEWVPISTLPDSLKKNAASQQQQQANGGGRAYSYYGVAPFVSRLRAWIKRQKKMQRKGVAGSSAVAPAEAAGVGGMSSQAISVAELETRLLATAAEAEATATATTLPPSTSRQQKAGVKAVEGSPMRNQKARRRDKQRQSKADTRDKATFGSDGGMNSRERDLLFKEYVVETDRRAATLGLGDDCWPVQYVTSKDFSAEDLARVQAAKERREGPAAVAVAAAVAARRAAFVFDRVAIREVMEGTA